MNTTYLRRDLIMRGARCARGDHLGRLEQLADRQLRIRCSKLESELERIRDQLRDDAHLMKQAHDAINELENELNDARSGRLPSG